MCDDNIRRELARLCTSKRTRRVLNSPTHPCRWFPYETRNDETGTPFTEQGAWELIQGLLEGGHPVETIELRKPPGKTGYVLKYPRKNTDGAIYIKLQLGSGEVYGRSFHESEPNRDETD